MAILDSSFKTGCSWVAESEALFKANPRRWLLVGLIYIALFMALPALPGMEFFGLIMLLLWPTALAVIMALFRNADNNTTQSLAEVIKAIQVKINPLIGLGAACLLYVTAINYLLAADIEAVAAITKGQTIVNQAKVGLLLDKLLPLLLKSTLYLTPLLIVTWFSPMLIAFNNYPLGKAVKSSIAGCIQYLVALGAAWLLFTLRIFALVLIASIFVGLLSILLPVISSLLMSLFMLVFLVIPTTLMLAIQYVSYRDVFRAA
jgi:hypothetical protein